VFGPDIIEYAEQLVQQVRENLRVAQTRQKSLCGCPSSGPDLCGG
jgi:hypothetical protein